MKTKICVVVVISLLVIGILVYKNSDNYDGLYEIFVEKIDDLSPDRHLRVLRNGKETKKYKYITFNNEEGVIVCYEKNPTVNVFELEVDELVIVLPNDEKTIAKVIKEEK